MQRCIFFVIFSLVLIASIPPVFGGYVLKNGKFTQEKTLATLPAQEHYNQGLKAIEEKNWKEAQKQFGIVTVNFSKTPLGLESFYHLGVAEFQLDELDFANEAFTNYLKLKNNPKYFQDAIVYKYEIANKLADGAKRRFLGLKRMPKWATGRTLALKIYDEVIAALPSHEMAVKALFSKGKLLQEMRSYKQAIESYQLITKRFPKHELVPQSYQAISKIFVEQAQHELQNPDLLTFAEINLKKFKMDFPRDEGVRCVEEDFLEMKEIYAQGLYDTAEFYERKGKSHASVLYYQRTLEKFPSTETAQQASEKLKFLEQKKER